MHVFVTGASGWIGSALVPELIAAGHNVSGLARSEASAKALEEAGAEAVIGTLDDLDTLRRAAAASDGVVHLAFKHDIAFTGQFEAAADADRLAVEAFGEALAGTNKPFVLASGVLGLAPGRIATERDRAPVQSGAMDIRRGTAQLTVDFASRGVRSSVVRLPPTVHGPGDNGFMPRIVETARQKGSSGYIADGSSRWPAAHRLDVANLFRLALENATAGSLLHAIGEEGVATRAIAEVIGRHLDLPIVSVAPADALAHFGFLGMFFGIDSPASSALTQEQLHWHPTHPGLLDDLEAGSYFEKTTV